MFETCVILINNSIQTKVVSKISLNSPHLILGRRKAKHSIPKPSKNQQQTHVLFSFSLPYCIQANSTLYFSTFVVKKKILFHATHFSFFMPFGCCCKNFVFLLVISIFGARAFFSVIYVLFEKKGHKND